MKVSRRRLVLIVAALALTVVGIFVVLPVVRIAAFFKGMARRAERGRERLFLETDYDELLAACRELLKQTPSGAGSRVYRVYLGRRDPETLTFPQVILDLEPALVDIRPGDGTVLIQLFPGPEWFGVMASAEYRDGYCAVKLIDGLWYSDAEYGSEHPEYVEKITKMIEEGRRRKETRRSVPTPQPTLRSATGSSDLFQFPDADVGGAADGKVQDVDAGSADIFLPAEGAVPRAAEFEVCDLGADSRTIQMGKQLLQGVPLQLVAGQEKQIVVAGPGR